MISIDPKALQHKIQGYLQGSVGPSPLHLQVLLMQTETLICLL
jgi:hypothetical protein